MQTDSIVVDSPPKSGSFQHLRSAALLGPDRRNLIEFYWQGGRLYKEDDSLKSRSEAEEIEGSIDRCLVTIEWAVVLDELADHG